MKILKVIQIVIKSSLIFKQKMILFSFRPKFLEIHTINPTEKISSKKKSLVLIFRKLTKIPMCKLRSIGIL